MHVTLLHRLARLGDEIPADAVADAATARMEHHPETLALVEADLDEVVAAAQGAHLPHRLLLGVVLLLGVLRMLFLHSLVALLQVGTSFAPCVVLVSLVESDGL